MIRKGQPEDLPFIYTTWLRSFKMNSNLAKEIDKDTYYKFHKLIIERILARTAEVYVAVDNEDQDVIHGYMVAEGPVLHFAYVKKSFRGLGLFTDMFRIHNKEVSPIIALSHLTKAGKEFLTKHPEIKYNPYVL